MVCKRSNVVGKLLKFKNYFILEPLVFCWLFPSVLNFVAIQNLSLEKACHLNLKYDKYVCEKIFAKADSDDEDECDVPEEEGGMANETDVMSLMGANSSMDVMAMSANTSIDDPMNFNQTKCKIEIETQQAVAFINGIRGPIASIFPIIVILFAGGWSDKKGLRKPCLLVPMIGEFLAASALLISAIFMDTIPMEFGNICEKVLPALLGGQTLMIMAIYSYLTAITEEADRTFRFGLFGIFVAILPTVGYPLGGTLFTHLGYVRIFIISDAILLVGIVYLIFVIKEIKPADPAPDPVTNGDGNAAPQNSNGAKREELKIEQIDSKKSEANSDEKKKNCCAEFFDPTLTLDCARVYTTPRKHRLYLWILTIAFLCNLGPNLGEAEYYYQFAQLQLKWNGEKFGFFSSYSSAITTLGTFIMTGVVTKCFQLSDSMIGLLSTICTVISRPMMAFAKDSLMYYVGNTVDMFAYVKAIAIKSILSKFVLNSELGRLYAVLGVMEALAGFFFLPIYSFIYSNTIETFPGGFYMFGEIFFIANAILFGMTYVVMRNPKNKTDDDDTASNNIESTATEIETTHV